MTAFPTSRKDLERRFTDDTACLDYLAEIRWENGFACPDCPSTKSWKIKPHLMECAACGRQVSVTSGTIFHKTRKPMSLWFRVIWDMVASTTGISARNAKRQLGFGGYQTSWTWLHKLRKAMIRPNRERLSGVVQVDETYWGGAKPGKRGRGALGKAIIAIAVEDKGGENDKKNKIGRIRLKMVKSASRNDLWDFISESIEPNSLIVTDGLVSYKGIESQGYKHEVVESLDLRLAHLVASLLKRWILGTHQGAVRSSHFPAYLDEFTFRFNRRTSGSRGKLFYRALQNCVLVKAPPLKDLKSSNPNDKDENFDDIYENHNI